MIYSSNLLFISQDCLKKKRVYQRKISESKIMIIRNGNDAVINSRLFSMG